MYKLTLQILYASSLIVTISTTVMVANPDNRSSPHIAFYPAFLIALMGSTPIGKLFLDYADELDREGRELER